MYTNYGVRMNVSYNYVKRKYNKYMDYGVYCTFYVIN